MKKQLSRIIRIFLIPLALGVDPSWAAGVHGVFDAVECHATGKYSLFHFYSNISFS